MLIDCKFESASYNITDHCNEIPRNPNVENVVVQ